MKIGNIITRNNIVLAPMAGVTDSAFRTMCLENGAGLICCEMVSDKALNFYNEKTLDMIKIWENEHPVSMQIFGSDEKTISDAAKLILKNSNPDIIDINMGCPVKKVVSNGSGSALLKDPDKIYSIVKTLTDTIDVPVTVKIRAGFDHNSINCDKVARIIESAGASAITIHGRTRSDMYTGTANLEYIKMVKDAVSIPVIGNGDIKDIESAVRMIEYTGVDGIMVGRASFGNPWIFRELSSYFEEGKIIERPTKEEVIAGMLEHARRLVELKGEHVAVIEMRTHGPWYLKQLIGTKQYRVEIVAATSLSQITDVAKKVLLDPNVLVK